jgi:hypothetical protein
MGNQQEPLGGRMELVARIEEVHSGGVTERRLTCHCNGDLITDVEPSECSLRGVGGDNAVVGREPAAEVALNRGENVRVAVNS